MVSLPYFRRFSAKPIIQQGRRTENIWSSPFFNSLGLIFQRLTSGAKGLGQASHCGSRSISQYDWTQTSQLHWENLARDNRGPLFLTGNSPMFDDVWWCWKGNSSTFMLVHVADVPDVPDVPVRRGSPRAFWPKEIRKWSAERQVVLEPMKGCLLSTLHR